MEGGKDREPLRGLPGLFIEKGYDGLTAWDERFSSVKNNDSAGRPDHRRKPETVYVLAPGGGEGEQSQWDPRARLQTMKGCCEATKNLRQSA